MPIISEIVLRLVVEALLVIASSLLMQSKLRQVYTYIEPTA